MSVGKIPRKFTDVNIPLVFPFVFIGFLVVCEMLTDIIRLQSQNIPTEVFHQ